VMKGVEGLWRARGQRRGLGGRDRRAAMTHSVTTKKTRIGGGDISTRRRFDARRDAPFAPSSARAAAWRRCVPSSRVRGLESSSRGATRGCWNGADSMSDRIVVATQIFIFGNSDFFEFPRCVEFETARRDRGISVRSRVPAIFAAVDGAFRRAKWRQNIAFPT
jgi:hypothetical protein